MVDWVRARLSRKLTLLILGLIYLFSGAIGLLIFRQSVSSLEAESYGRLQQMARAYAMELDIEIANAMQITESLYALMVQDFDAEQAARPGYLEDRIARYDPYVREVAQELSLAKTAYIYYNWELDGHPHDIYYADADQDGRVSRQAQLPASYFTDPYSERGSRDWWLGPQRAEGPYWSTPYRWVFDDGTSTIFVSHTRAAFAGDRLIGVAGTDFNYNNILALMNRITVYDTGFPFLINGEGRLLIHPSQEGSLLAELPGEPFGTLALEAREGLDGAFSYREADGREWLITYQRLRNEWVLGLAAPVDEVTQRARDMTPLMLTLFAGAVPLIAFAAYAAARRMTCPVQELTAAVRRIEAGDYTPDLSRSLLARMDEMGALGTAVRNMGLSLQDSIALITDKNLQLEAAVQEKDAAHRSFNLVYEAFAAADNGLVVTDDRLRIIHANPAFLRLTAFEGDPLDQGLESVIRTGFPEARITLAEGQFHQQKILREGPEGYSRYLWLMMNRIEVHGGGYRYICILEDRTEAIHQARSIRYLKDHDVQTGLLNKSAALEAIGQCLTEGTAAALIVLNIDDLRLVNEALGYECGDAVIQGLSDRLRAVLHPEDILARTAGDEFLAFVRTIGSVQDIAETARRLVQAGTLPVPCRDREVFVSLSAGIAVYPFDSDRLEQLMICSAAALNHAKTLGKNGLQFYSQDLVEKAFERYELSNQLREGLEREEFFLLYQPILRVPEGTMTEAEALIRWHHPEKGILTPDRFISLAESSGAIGPMGDWVLETVCKALKAWDADSGGPLRVSVNLSALQLGDPDFGARVSAILERTGVSGRRINLEITESTLMARSPAASDNLARLKAAGMEIHIDDFGTGFSSLAYLRDFQVDVLKIDRSFIRGIPEADGGDLARLVIDLGRSLGIKVIAEGVETEAQAKFLHQQGCRLQQGYLYSRPVPFSSLEAFRKSLRTAEAWYNDGNTAKETL